LAVYSTGSVRCKRKDQLETTKTPNRLPTCCPGCSLAIMWIDISDAVRIYASMLRARLGPIRGARAARETADRLRAKGDWSGVEAWEAVAAELAPLHIKE
jgi:hypothetical protein